MVVSERKLVKVIGRYKILQKQPPEVFCKKKVFLEILQNSQEKQRLFFNKVAGFRQTLVQVFSCEFCEISKKTFFTEHLSATASDISHEGKIW